MLLLVSCVTLVVVAVTGLLWEAPSRGLNKFSQGGYKQYGRRFLGGGMVPQYALNASCKKTTKVKLICWLSRKRVFRSQISLRSLLAEAGQSQVKESSQLHSPRKAFFNNLLFL